MLDLSQCKGCNLWKTRTQVVVGEGNPHADIVFVGECPGPDEDKQGRPFIGRAGQLLRGILDDLGVDTGLVYITNLVKCYPFHSLNPSGEHIIACAEYMGAQLQSIQPKLIVTLGRHSSEYFIGRYIKITKESGKIRPHDNQPGVSVLPIVHPSYVLRGNRKPEDYVLDFLPMLEFYHGT